MPRKRSSGDGGLYYVPSRKLWRGVIDLGFGPDGRRRQKQVHARTQVEARRKLEQLKKEIAEHGAPLDKATTVATWALRWLDDIARPKISPNAFTAYKSMVNQWIIPTIGHKRVALLKPSDVRAVTKAMLDAGRSSSSARKAHYVLSAMLDEARAEGLIGRNIVEDVDTPAKAVSTRTALSHQQALAMLSTSAADVDGTRWWMAILEGLRQAERLGAQIADLDLENRTYTVRWTLNELTFEHGCGKVDGGAWPCGYKRAGSCPDRRHRVPLGYDYRPLVGRYCLTRPKSGKPRTVPLIEPVAVALRRYLDATAHIPNPHGLIWRNPDGSPINPNDDEQAWRDLMHRAQLITAEQTLPPRARPAGTPDVPTSHTARHTTATVLMELKVPIKVIGEILGHASENVTLGYQHVTSEEARAAMERMAERFAEALALPEAAAQ